MKTWLVGVIALVSATSFASGFKCTSETYNVLLRNKVHGATRTPAVLVVSTEEEGTLLVRKGAQIQKSNLTNVVRYTVRGNSAINAGKVILQVNFKEGQDELEAGEEVPGSLILVKGERRKAHRLSCERYLKN